MSFKNFKKISVPIGQTVDAETINNIQDNIAKALSQVLGKDFLDMNLLKDIVLFPGMVNPVPHGLGRKITGYIIVGNHGGYSLITDNQDINNSKELLLLLTTPALVKVDLLVF